MTTRAYLRQRKRVCRAVPPICSFTAGELSDPSAENLVKRPKKPLEPLRQSLPRPRLLTRHRTMDGCIENERKANRGYKMSRRQVINLDFLLRLNRQTLPPPIPIEGYMAMQTTRTDPQST